LGHRVGQRTAQDGPRIADRPLGGHAPTASCRNLGAASPPHFRAPGILGLRATLAGLPQLVQPGPHVAQGELVEPLLAEEGHDVQPTEDLIGRTRQRRVARRDNYLAQPVGQVVSHRWVAGRDRSPASRFMEAEPLTVYLLAGLAVDPLAAPP